MTWHPTGHGGEWILALRGKTKVIQCPNLRVNALDELYEQDENTSAPQTSGEYAAHDAPLVEGAFWKLIELMLRSE